MNPSLTNHERVLAIDPFSRGFGLAVLEGEEELIDWGLKSVRSTVANKNAWCIKQVGYLITQYEPSVIVLENVNGKGSRRGMRVKRLIKQTVALTSKSGLKIYKVSRSEILKVFAESGAFNKHQIAIQIAKRFPELAPRLPPARKPWKSEDERMSIFDAMAFALAFFYFERERKAVSD
jgi:Holliday junction resolvasome RuvABC endonuclease subunit